MKNQLFFLLICLFAFSKAQKTEVCKCDLLKKSNDSIKDSYSKYRFKPISKRAATKPPFDFISIKYLKKYADSKNIVDALEIKVESFFKSNKIEDDYKQYKAKDSIKKIEFLKTIGNIPEPLIIKSGKLDHSIAVLYQTEDYYKSKYYIAISNDEGKTWKNFYTGLIKNFNYVFKNNSQFPLWKDKYHIQIEADIVRMAEPMNFPGPQEKYETVKNNALISINLNEIIKDSDKDGFNDLEENLELFTNPLSYDTDNDGIYDYEDKNPKYKEANNDFTRLLQGILYGDYPVTEGSDIRESEFIINFKTFEKDFKNPSLYFFEKEKKFSDSFDFRVMITDNGYLKQITPVGNKIIVLTSQEFAAYMKINFMNRYMPHYSKLFKCQDKEDSYLFIVDNIWMGYTYLIKRIPDGWLIKTVSSWQS
ncbi:hypothetical protein ATE47_09355 [Chryseobacterium sp. IHB B 17019]|nr:hypothetical protein ATE47_09355 [Chryseobacterium sp. IHB B 17019]